MEATWYFRAPISPVKLNRSCQIALLIAWLPLLAGCSLFPNAYVRETVHNPFPQMKRVAILPFHNQSGNPYVNGDQVADAYYAALQAIPGFEVLPVSVSKELWQQFSMKYGEPTSGPDFQRLAQMIEVEAIVVGSVTDFDSYSPPRMAMTVHWYAANEGFHAIPAGYGLPWGTEAEKKIPQRIVREAEFELARSQLATQTPVPTAPAPLNSTPLHPDPVSPNTITPDPLSPNPKINPTNFDEPFTPDPLDAPTVVDSHQFDTDEMNHVDQWAPHPNFPDPTDLIPDPPSPVTPVAIINHEPVLSHTRIYRGDDAYFTNRLTDYVETNDDSRPGGWQGYLYRSDDFIRFCCHLHITEMLESRGGTDQSDLILRWPLSRY